VKGWASPIRAWIGIAVAFLLCLAASLEYYSYFTDYYRQNPDPMGVGSQELRLAQLRAELPAPSVLGYYSDLPIGKGGGSALFYQTMYTMAPHLVVPDSASDKPELVLGSFYKRPDLDLLEREHGLRLIKDFGRGIRLFRRGGK
jgi:hypothetical protein